MKKATQSFQMKSADAHQQCASFCRISLHKILFDVSTPFQNTNFKKNRWNFMFWNIRSCIPIRLIQGLRGTPAHGRWSTTLKTISWIAHVCLFQKCKLFLSREIYFCQLPCRNIVEEPVRIIGPYRRSKERFKLSILFFNDWVFHGCSRSRARKLASCGWPWVLVIEPM